MQDHAREELHVIRALANGAARRLAYRRKGFRQEVVERFPGQEATAEFSRLVAQGLVGERFVVVFEGVGLRQVRPQLLYFALGRIAAEFGDPIEHVDGGASIVPYSAPGSYLLDRGAKHRADRFARVDA